MFWPDTDEERARHALSQTIYALRRDLGQPVVKADALLLLDPNLMTSDAADFRAALARRDWAAAFDLYQGRFAEGFSVAESPEFDRWLDEERAAFSREAESAFESLARDAARAGHLARSAEVWRRLTAMDPLSAGFAASYMRARAALGDRAGAIAHARGYGALVRRELDAEPDPLVSTLASELQSELGVAVPETLDPTAGPVPLPRSVEVAGAITRRWLRAAVGAVALITLTATVAVRWIGSQNQTPVLAVGQIRDLTAPDSVRLGGVLSEVLATSLARLDSVGVIANSRILELLERGADTIGSARKEAARRAGATELVEGELVPVDGGGQLRLDLRRVDIRRGTLRRGYSVGGTDRFALIDSATTLVAIDFGIGRPIQHLSAVTSSSPIALRLYEEGLRAYYNQADGRSGLRLLREALTEDSTFALAALQGYQLSVQLGAPDPGLRAQALRLADYAPDRDRILVLTSILTNQGDPRALPLADTLASRYPRDSEALHGAAVAMLHSRLLDARIRDLLDRAIAIDSAADVNPRAPCRLCRSLGTLADALLWADSIAAAERALERFVRLKPRHPAPIHLLAMNEFSRGRLEAGSAHLARLASYSETIPYSAVPLFIGRLLTGHLDEADAECNAQLHQTDARAWGPYIWLCPIVWRNQGRYQTAAAMVFSKRLAGGGSLPDEYRDLTNEAILDFEMGRPERAVRAYVQAARAASDQPPGLLARELVWNLTRRGTAAAALNDVQLLARLADSVEMIGKRSLYGRDALLHYFLRGLIASAAGDHHTATDFFRRSIYSTTFGYTRANLELARSLMALGRSGEAILPLQAALRGGWDGSNLYVTRTELHELLAQAFAAAGSPDSAAAHFTVVERSWRRADPPFTARYQAARDWLASRGRLRP